MEFAISPFMLQNKSLPQFLFFIANLLIVGGLSTAHAPLSIGQILVVVAVLVFIFQEKKLPAFFQDKYALGVSLMFWLPLISYFFTTDVDNWSKDLRIKLPFLFLPLAYSLAPRLSLLQTRLIALVFIVIHGFIGMGSVLKYYFDFTQNQITQDYILRNGTIPMISHIDHIYFGIFLSFSALWAFWWFIEPYFQVVNEAEIRIEWLKGAKFRYLMLFFAIFNALAIHLLTSRNGFLSFYTGVVTFIIYYIIQKRKYLLGSLALLITGLTPVLAYQYVPSFHSRIYVSIWDLQQYFQHKACDCSLTLRLIAWEKTFAIFKANPILGTGMGDVKNDLFASYKPENLGMEISPDLLPNEFLDSPHSQYLEHLAGLGIFGFLALIFALYYPFIFERKNVNFPQIALISIISVALLTESALERQWGIAFFVTFVMLLRKKPL